MCSFDRRMIAQMAESVSGLNWVHQQHRASGRPSVVALPLAGGVSTALDNAVATVSVFSLVIKRLSLISFGY